MVVEHVGEHGKYRLLEGILPNGLTLYLHMSKSHMGPLNNMNGMDHAFEDSKSQN